MTPEEIEKKFVKELGILNEDDKEVLADTIEFEKSSEGIRNLW